MSLPEDDLRRLFHQRADMARKRDVAQDYHIVPRTERENHQYDGAECPCEPRCVLQGPNTRVFLHQNHLIDVLKVPRTPPPNAGLIGPGPT